MLYHKKVILFTLSGKTAEPPILWRFFDYADAGWNIDDWYGSLTEVEQDVFDALLKTNAKAETPQDWNGCKMLQGAAKEEKIWEWRFHPSGRQQRILGIFGENRREAIFLIGCNHKQEVYDPPKCIPTAIKRAKDVRAKKVKLNARQIESNI